MEIIKRTTEPRPLWKVLENHHRGTDEWNEAKTVCVLRGLAGCGKTTYLLDYFKDKKCFYFSFAGLEENLAERMFAEHVAAETGVIVSTWADGFQVLSKKYRVILLDDVSSISTYKRFQAAFYDCMITSLKPRPFVALIAQPSDNVSGLADAYDEIQLDYFNIPEVMKLRPELSKFDALGLTAISGGVPQIMCEYDSQIGVAENLRNMLSPDSAFVRCMPELLLRYFRRPENYHHILCAIANDNHSVSEIGKFTGFAYNKCDNYLAGLIANGFVKTEKVESKHGTEKTAYVLENNYFRLWHKYVFMNRTGIQLGDCKTVEKIIRSIVDREIHAFHIEKAFALVNARIREVDVWSNFAIPKNIQYAPTVVQSGKFSYTFDALIQGGGKTLFVKIFESPTENCGRTELENIQKAVMLVNTYYDSKVYLFSKRRFSDYAVAEAAKVGTLSLVEIERLKF